MRLLLPAISQPVSCVISTRLCCVEVCRCAGSETRVASYFSGPDQFLSMATSLRAFWNSPVGPKTIHFWGPMANFGLVVAALVDIQKPPEMISGRMTSIMCAYSASYMRFAWMVRPQNLLLCGVHGCNEVVQLYQLQRWARWSFTPKPDEELGPVSSQEKH